MHPSGRVFRPHKQHSKDTKGSSLSLINKEVQILLNDPLQIILSFLQTRQCFLAGPSFLRLLRGNLCLRSYELLLSGIPGLKNLIFPSTRAICSCVLLHVIMCLHLSCASTMH